MNILDSRQVRHCTSCQVCGAACPVGAIQYGLNEDGFIRPSIDASVCIDCGLCVSICAKYDDMIKVTTNVQLNHYHLYAAYSHNDIVRSSTTSGGVADILAHHLLSQGYKVVGVIYDSLSNTAHHRIADTEDALLAFRGSKYIQPMSYDAFRTVVKDCQAERYAIFGLPCQIYSLSRYLEKTGKRGQCVLVDLFCHGCPSALLWEKVSQDIRRKTHLARFDNVFWRSKIKGWGMFVLDVQNAGKSVYHSTPLHNEFFDLYFSNQLLNESCESCVFRGTLEYTDIRLGDFWGPEYQKDKKGVSAVSVVTKQGTAVLDSVKNKLLLIDQQYDAFLPYQSWRHQYKINTELRYRLISFLKDKSVSLRETVSLLPSHHSIGWKLKTYVKQALFFMPNWLNRVKRH